MSLWRRWDLSGMVSVDKGLLRHVSPSSSQDGLHEANLSQFELIDLMDTRTMPNQH
jgi:hypothetical protein